MSAWAHGGRDGACVWLCVCGGGGDDCVAALLAGRMARRGVRCVGHPSPGALAAHRAHQEGGWRRRRAPAERACRHAVAASLLPPPLSVKASAIHGRIALAFIGERITWAYCARFYRRAHYMGVLRSLLFRGALKGGGRARQGMPPSPTPRGGGTCAWVAWVDFLHTTAHGARHGTADGNEFVCERAPGGQSFGLEWGRVAYVNAREDKTHMLRSYHHESTRSHQNSEVKRGWAGLVLG